jgi:hypothetical protein
LGSRRQAPDGWAVVTPWLKTEAPVSCPTEALFFAAAPSEPPVLNFSQALAAESAAKATAYVEQFSGFLCQSFHEIQRDQLSG